MRRNGRGRLVVAAALVGAAVALPPGLTPSTQHEDGSPPPASGPKVLDNPAEAVALPASARHIDGDGAPRPGRRAWAGSWGDVAIQVPAEAQQAYAVAAATLGAVDPGCGVTPGLLTAIGQVESAHGTASTAARAAEARRGRARDTDAGQLDGDRRADHPLGPFNLMPSQWVLAGVDGDGDGDRDPSNLADAATTTAVYLCSAAGDLTTESGRRAALRTLHPDAGYVDAVLAVAAELATRELAFVRATYVPAATATDVDRAPIRALLSGPDAKGASTKGRHQGRGHEGRGQEGRRHQERRPARSQEGHRHEEPWRRRRDAGDPQDEPQDEPRQAAGRRRRARDRHVRRSGRGHHVRRARRAASRQGREREGAGPARPVPGPVG